MKNLKFTKMQARGNDFVVIEGSSFVRRPSSITLPSLAVKFCDRKFGIGADGLLILEKSKIADVKMRIFNADGSEAEMCGNGASCVALWVKSQRHKATSHPSASLGTGKSQVKIETNAGIIECNVKGNDVKIKLTDPKDIRLDIPIKLNNRKLKVNYIDTGVPHTVIFVDGIENLNVSAIGSEVRYHSEFSPRGTNANFIEIKSKDLIKIRTYERGVEDETLACGTGSVASAIIFAIKSDTKNKIIRVQTKSGEMLKVYFDKINKKFSNVWLEGKASIVFGGNVIPPKGGITFADVPQKTRL